MRIYRIFDFCDQTQFYGVCGGNLLMILVTYVVYINPLSGNLPLFVIGIVAMFNLLWVVKNIDEIRDLFRGN
jgi:hypothetical protein